MNVAPQLDELVRNQIEKEKKKNILSDRIVVDEKHILLKRDSEEQEKMAKDHLPIGEYLIKGKEYVLYNL